jgi:hypothetical protein
MNQLQLSMNGRYRGRQETITQGNNREALKLECCITKPVLRFKHTLDRHLTRRTVCESDSARRQIRQGPCDRNDGEHSRQLLWLHIGAVRPSDLRS